jgi:hypothetical protein
MPAARARRRREVVVHVEERRARNVAVEVKLPPALRVCEIPATVDERIPVAHGERCELYEVALTIDNQGG